MGGLTSGFATRRSQQLPEWSFLRTRLCQIVAPEGGHAFWRLNAKCVAADSCNLMIGDIQGPPVGDDECGTYRGRDATRCEGRVA